ncbi:MAG: arginine--tRNA ligase [Acidobacteriia bacterium]|nr:arginine--tRNA ligase [Terriglobia bacterium]
MYRQFQEDIRRHFLQYLKSHFGIENMPLKLETPPQVNFGEIALPVAFDLAKQLKKAPRAIAQDIAETVGSIEGVVRVSVAAAGYLNLHLDRSRFLRRVLTAPSGARPPIDPGPEKIIVEHTNINPNKAAHIGHLRNAVLGDSFVRLLRSLGRTVEVQNYIDNTGVQVADVVVGFEHIEKLSASQVEERIGGSNGRFDFYCWDLYARVSRFYDEDADRLKWRSETLHRIEHGGNDTARLADLMATAIVRAHLATMSRINVQYDLLPRESDILHLKFWDQAFTQLKDRGAIVLETAGKNKGCWVMRAEGAEKSSPANEESAHDEDKIIVRSNGTVTYVGKDIAYQLWKFGLLGKDFYYSPFHTYSDGHVLWMTRSEPASRATPPPHFGKGSAVYNVIDVRQSYLQNVVVQGLRTLGFQEAAEHSTHFDYEMVALSPRCCSDLGIELSAEDQKRPYVEVSGRKGLGVKADDLIDQLIRKSREEVAKRHPDMDVAGMNTVARQIAVGGLRYFLLKYTLHSVIAFDFDEALSFEGETGPYIQYAVVRSKNIFRKLAEEHKDFSLDDLRKKALLEDYRGFLDGPEHDEFWTLILLASQLSAVVAQAVSSREPATVAKFAFNLAQTFNNFYHKHRILPEPDAKKKEFLLVLVDIVARTLEEALNLLGIEVPERM